MDKQEIISLLQEFKLKVSTRFNSAFKIGSTEIIEPQMRLRETSDSTSVTTHYAKETFKSNYTLNFKGLAQSKIGIHTDFKLTKTYIGLCTFNIDTFLTIIMGLFSLVGAFGIFFSIAGIVQYFRGEIELMLPLIIIPSTILAVYFAVFFYKKDQDRKKELMEDNPLQKAKEKLEYIVKEEFANLNMEQMGFTLKKESLNIDQVMKINNWASSSTVPFPNFEVPYDGTFYRLNPDSIKAFSFSDVEEVYKNKGDWEYFTIVHKDEPIFEKELEEYIEKNVE